MIFLCSLHLSDDFELTHYERNFEITGYNSQGVSMGGTSSKTKKHKKQLSQRESQISILNEIHRKEVVEANNVTSGAPSSEPPSKGVIVSSPEKANPKLRFALAESEELSEASDSEEEVLRKRREKLKQRRG